MNIIEKYIDNKLDSQKIITRRRTLYKQIKGKNIFSNGILNTIFSNLHKKYFGLQLSDNIKLFYNNHLRTSSSVLKTYLTNSSYQYEIHVSNKIFNQILSKRNLLCNGIICKNVYMCLIVTLEHEYIHYLISMYCENDLKNGSHTKLFKILMRNMFGHLHYKHQLLKN